MDTEQLGREWDLMLEQLRRIDRAHPERNPQMFRTLRYSAYQFSEHGNPYERIAELESELHGARISLGRAKAHAGREEAG